VVSEARRDGCCGLDWCNLDDLKIQLSHVVIGANLDLGDLRITTTNGWEEHFGQ
jgi:hypothetical protein